jgi:type II secretory pathway component PulF
VIQLVAAIGILSLVIWITGAFDLEIDMLGLGLRGTSGVLTFWAIIAAVGGGLYFLYRSFRNGAIWMRPVTELLPRIPWIGGCLRDFALARLTWAMHMTLETGMELKRALPLCLRSTQFEPYERHSNDIVLDVTQGREISEALAATGAFPEELIDSVRNGELAGRLPESMNILSLQYRDRAQQAMGVLTMIAGFAVWGMVAILLIVMIFRVFFQAYLGPIYENLPK